MCGDSWRPSGPPWIARLGAHRAAHRLPAACRPTAGCGSSATCTEIGQDWFDEDHTVVDGLRPPWWCRPPAGIGAPALARAAVSAMLCRHWQVSRSSAAAGWGKHCCRVPARGRGRSKTWWWSSGYRARQVSGRHLFGADHLGDRGGGKRVIRRRRRQARRRRGGDVGGRAGGSRGQSDTAEQVFVTVAAGVTITYFE